MRKRRALALIAMLAVQATCVLGDGTVFPPNPVGEAVYRQHLLPEMLPLVVIVCALLLGWLLHATHHKAKTQPSDDFGLNHN
jgi:hypothetical protein